MDRDKKIIKTSVYGIVVNILLVIFKATVGLIANSIAIILDAVNNLTDAISSIITIIGTKLASKEADREHPFGHGRIEYFASVIIAMIILIAGLTSFKESFEKIIHPEEANYSIYTLIIVSVAVVVKFVFGRYVKNIGKKINSQSLVASGQDAFMDSILSFSTFIAALISIFFGLSLEGYLGAVISIVIIKASVDILRETLRILIGERASQELTDKIKKKICEFDGVEGAYDLTLHNYGPTKIIGTVHIQVEDNMTAKEIHKLTRNITLAMYSEFGIVFTIGIYASNTGEKETARIKEKLEKIISKYSQILQMHGFYVDEETKNISFDLIIDFKESNPEEIRDKVLKEIKEEEPDYTYYAILDADYSD